MATEEDFFDESVVDEGKESRCSSKVVSAIALSIDFGLS